MQTTTLPRTPPRVRRTHQAIEDAARAIVGPLGAHGVLVGERRDRVALAQAMTRRELERHLVQHALPAQGLTRKRLLEIADAVRATPSHRAPVVIATVEGRVILQWLEELSS